MSYSKKNQFIFNRLIFKDKINNNIEMRFLMVTVQI
jgi:hypothetical protein